MKTIWKFQSLVRDEIYVSGPAPLNVIHVESDGASRLTIWAEVDSAGDPSQLTRMLFVVGTGHPIPVEAGEHLASVVAPPFVWHVYNGGLLK